MKIGIFGGSFNPIHNGHIKMAEKFIERAELDRLIVMPTGAPFYKFLPDLAKADDRLEMCKIAFGNNKKIIVSDIETKSEGKVYTYDTLCRIKQQYPDSSLFMLVGSDVLNSIVYWYKSDEILSVAKICAFCRPGAAISPKIMEKIQSKTINIELFGDPMPDISSTMVREKIRNGDGINNLISKSVLDYIKENHIDELWK